MRLPTSKRGHLRIKSYITVHDFVHALYTHQTVKGRDKV